MTLIATTPKPRLHHESTRYTTEEVAEARAYYGGLSDSYLRACWRAACDLGVSPPAQLPFGDWLVEDARETQYCKLNDC